MDTILGKASRSNPSLQEVEGPLQKLSQGSPTLQSAKIEIENHWFFNLVIKFISVSFLFKVIFNPILSVSLRLMHLSHNGDCCILCLGAVAEVSSDKGTIVPLPTSKPPQKYVCLGRGICLNLH